MKRMLICVLVLVILFSLPLSVGAIPPPPEEYVVPIIIEDAVMRHAVYADILVPKSAIGDAYVDVSTNIMELGLKADCDLVTLESDGFVCLGAHTNAEAQGLKLKRQNERVILDGWIEVDYVRTVSKEGRLIAGETFKVAAFDRNGMLIWCSEETAFDDPFNYEYYYNGYPVKCSIAGNRVEVDRVENGIALFYAFLFGPLIFLLVWVARLIVTRSVSLRLAGLSGFISAALTAVHSFAMIALGFNSFAWTVTVELGGGAILAGLDVLFFWLLHKKDDIKLVLKSGIYTSAGIWLLEIIAAAMLVL